MRPARPLALQAEPIRGSRGRSPPPPESAPRRARPGGSHASALQPQRRASFPPGSPRRKPCFCTTAETPSQLPAGLAPAEAMLLHYSRTAEPAPRRARPGGSRAFALQRARRASSPPGSPRRKPCFCTTARPPSQLPAGLAPAEAMLLHYSRNAEPAPRRARPGGSNAFALQPNPLPTGPMVKETWLRRASPAGASSRANKTHDHEKLRSDPINTIPFTICSIVSPPYSILFDSTRNTCHTACS